MTHQRATKFSFSPTDELDNSDSEEILCAIGISIKEGILHPSTNGFHRSTIISSINDSITNEVGTCSDADSPIDSKLLTPSYISIGGVAHSYKLQRS